MPGSIVFLLVPLAAAQSDTMWRLQADPNRGGAASLCSQSCGGGVCCVHSPHYGTGSYGNAETCSMVTLVAGTITSESFSTADVEDNVMLLGHRYTWSRGPDGVAAPVGTLMSWVSDSSSTAGGWSICLTPTSPNDQPVQDAPHEYDAPLGGGCRGPRGEEHVSGKARDHVATQAECQSSCDDEAACLGYRYHGNIGDCYLYGPGPWHDVWYTARANGPPRPDGHKPIDMWYAWEDAPPVGTDTIARGVSGGAGAGHDPVPGHYICVVRIDVGSPQAPPPVPAPPSVPPAPPPAPPR
eukprot:COSAG06_NODE_14439_length_1156_cov_1.822138_1_plen_296_part_01